MKRLSLPGIFQRKGKNEEQRCDSRFTRRAQPYYSINPHLCPCRRQVYSRGNAWFKTFAVHSNVGKTAAFTGTARAIVAPTPLKKRRTPGTPPPAELYTWRKQAAMLRVEGSRGLVEAFYRIFYRVLETTAKGGGKGVEGRGEEEEGEDGRGEGRKGG